MSKFQKQRYDFCKKYKYYLVTFMAVLTKNFPAFDVGEQFSYCVTRIASISKGVAEVS